MVLPDETPRLRVYARNWPIVLCHGIALVGPFVVRFSRGLVGLAAILYVVRMCLLSAGYHRYFAHRAFKTSRAFQFFLALAGGTCTQRGALWWAANHRHHHAHSDRPSDVHSPVRDGLYWSHLGWFLSGRYQATDFDRVRDFARYPELRWLDRHHYVPSWLYLGTLVALAGWSAGIWGCFVSTTFMWHATFCINSLAHRFAYFPFGSGPRTCIGNTFAEIEGSLAVGHICRRFELRVPPHARIAPYLGVTLLPHDNVLELEVRRRTATRPS